MSTDPPNFYVTLPESHASSYEVAELHYLAVLFFEKTSTGLHPVQTVAWKYQNISSNYLIINIVSQEQ